MADPQQPKPHFEHREAFRVLGVEAPAWHIDEVDPGFNDLWLNRFMAHHDQVQPHSADQAYYGVWFGTLPRDLSQGTHLAGMAIEGDPPVPDGWVIRDIPAADYAVFDSTLHHVGSATEFALWHWLPESEFAFDTTKPRFDWMPPDTAGPDSLTAVWIPVIHRG